MENKRFTIKTEYEKSSTSHIDGDYEFYYIFDHQRDTYVGNGERYKSDLADHCDLLNELHDENLKLKEQLERLAKP